MALVPERKTDAPLRLPISGAYKIKGVGDVLAGRVEQGELLSSALPWQLSLLQMNLLSCKENGQQYHMQVSFWHALNAVKDMITHGTHVVICAGVVKPGDEVIFLPTHTAANPCIGKVFTVEMHHKRVEKAGPGDNVGMNIKGLDKGNMPRTGESCCKVSKNVSSCQHALVPSWIQHLNHLKVVRVFCNNHYQRLSSPTNIYTYWCCNGRK
jgi:translation elongation factor EF-1alpha